MVLWFTTYVTEYRNGTDLLGDFCSHLDTTYLERNFLVYQNSFKINLYYVKIKMPVQLQVTDNYQNTKIQV